MIKKLSTRNEPYGDWAIRQEAPSNFELMEKINEIIDYLNANNE